MVAFICHQYCYHDLTWLSLTAAALLKGAVFFNWLIVTGMAQEERTIMEVMTVLPVMAHGKCDVQCYQVSLFWSLINSMYLIFV